MKGKEVVYVDIEDEITSIIDKVTSSKSKIVALVLPKRATVFQSIVNMKLLKRSADRNKKNVVLITSDESILPMAGAVKLHVAKTLQSTPDVPDAPIVDDKPIKITDKSGDEEKPDVNKSIGELAGMTAVSGAAEAAGSEEDPIEVGGDEPKESKLDKLKEKKYKLPGNKKIKIPNFEKFRLWLILGAVILILLIVGFIWANKVLPGATITIKTKTQSYNANLTLTLSSAAKTLDPTNDIVPAKIETMTKTSTSASVTTTGQKTIGTPATGTIVVTNECNNPSSYTIPAGDVFTDSSGTYSYASTSAETISGVKFLGSCKQNNWTTANVPVAATEDGSNYNIQPTSFSSTDSNLEGIYSMQSTSAMSGGTSSVVQVVAPQDLTNAQTQLTAPSSTTIQQQLEQSLKQQGLDPITTTFSAGTPTYTPSAEAGAQVSSVTISESIVFTMYGVQQSYLQTLVDSAINTQIDPTKQSILNNGLSTATYSAQSSTSTTNTLAMSDTATVGPNFNVNQLKSQVLGKKSGDIQSLIQSDPGVTSVSVHFSPFWVSSTPNNVNKVKITIEKANGSTL
ncbi:MAG TPA: hypothetical protein VMR34_05090 [Candidatus Saccharimonadales bacterium]|nr:hypothetical protein [Candidatus Saccharimonadales bacterium]